MIFIMLYIQKENLIEKSAFAVDKKKKKREVRYLDGNVVSSKGEKYIIVDKKEENQDTFCNIKIKPKGKRGPSPNFK